LAGFTLVTQGKPSSYCQAKYICRPGLSEQLKLTSGQRLIKR